MNPPPESEHPEPPTAPNGGPPPFSPEDAGDAPFWDGQPVWMETEPSASSGEPGDATLSEEKLYPPAELAYPVVSEGEHDPAAAPGFEYVAPTEGDLSDLTPSPYEHLPPVEKGHVLSSSPEPDAGPYTKSFDFAAYEAGDAALPEPSPEAAPVFDEPLTGALSEASYLSLVEAAPPAPDLPPGVPDEEVALLCEGLERFLGTAEARVHVLRGVSLRLEPGFVHAVVGPSGCGKSSLLYILGLLDRPDAGRLIISGRPVANLDDDDLSRQRNVLLGFIFQFHFLLQDFTAQENIMIPMRQLGVLAEPQMRERADYLLDAVGLGDKGHRASRHLSGGEQQRVAIARALANDPQVILADEPTGNLDTANSTRVFSLLTDLVHRENKALLLVTHNPAIAEACDWTHTMRDGLIVNQKYAGVRH